MVILLSLVFYTDPPTHPCLWGLGVPSKGPVHPLHLILFPLVPPGLAPSTPITLWCLQPLPGSPPPGNMLKLSSTPKAPSFDLVLPLSFPFALSLVKEPSSVGGRPPPLIAPHLCIYFYNCFQKFPVPDDQAHWIHVLPYLLGLLC